jgi:hypothetical protein
MGKENTFLICILAAVIVKKSSTQYVVKKEGLYLRHQMLSLIIIVNFLTIK